MASAIVADGIRLTRRYPGLAGLTIGGVSLSIGATLVVFTIVNALWIRPRPVVAPDRVVLVTTDVSSAGDGDSNSYSEYGLRRLADSNAFTAVVGQVQTTVRQGAYALPIRIDGVGRSIESLGVTASYFSMLGVPIRGHDFTNADDRIGEAPVAIISDRLWHSAFGGRIEIVNTVVPATPLPLRIVGIAPPGFEGALIGERTEVWVPANLVSRLVSAPATALVPFAALARLRPEVTPSIAEQLIAGVMPGNGHSPHPSHVVSIQRIFAAPNHRTILIEEGPVLWVVGLTAVLVFFGGCMTIAALVLVHYERRRQELGVRLALGASRSALVGQVARELGVLAVAGCAGAFFVANWSLSALPAFSLPAGVDLGRLDLAIDWRVFAVAVAGSLITLAAATALPAIRFTRAGVAANLISSGATTTASSQRVRQAMLAVHVAATVVVLISAGLFVRTIAYGFTQGAGFDVERTLFVDLQTRVYLGGDEAGRSATARTTAATVHRLIESLRELPGVEGVAVGDAPLGLRQASRTRESVDVDVDGDPRSARFVTTDVGPDYLQTIGVPILAGRALGDQDISPDGNGATTLITASLAEALWPGQSPVGHRLALAGRVAHEQTVVGVVADMAYGSLLSSAPSSFNATTVDVLANFVEHFGLAIRSADPAGTLGPAQRLVNTLFPDAPRADVATGRELVARDLGRQRLGAWFFSGFGLIALVLGVCGVFGLIAYLAESRRKELGIRLALGATSRTLIGTALTAGLEPVLIGTGGGIVGAILLARTTESLLVGVSGLDAATYVGAGLLTVAVALAAGLAAALRIRRLSPMDLLRVD